MLNLYRGYSSMDDGRRYKVIINGKVVDRIAADSCSQYELPIGEVEIYCKVDWCRSNKITKTVNAQDSITLAVSNRYTGLLALWNMVCVIFTPHKYLLLEEMSGALLSQPSDTPELNSELASEPVI